MANLVPADIFAWIKSFEFECLMADYRRGDKDAVVKVSAMRAAAEAILYFTK